MFERIKETVRSMRESDPYMKVSPLELVRQYSASLPRMAAEERTKAVIYAKWHADYYHSKRVEAIPAEVRKAVDEFAFRADRMNAHDRAKQFLAQYGPPEQALKAFISQSNNTHRYFHEQAQTGNGNRHGNQQGERLRAHDPAVREAMQPKQEQAEEQSQGQRIG